MNENEYLKSVSKEHRYFTDRTSENNGVDFLGYKESEAKKLLHELRIQNIQLEMQRRKLQKAKEDFETSRMEYFNWRRHSPETNKISELCKLNEHKRKLEYQLHQSQKMESLGELAGGIAHDFNNILTGIIGYSELALENLRPNDPVSEMLFEILKASESAATVTRQLLNFSKKQQIEAEVTNPNDLLMSMGKLLKQLIGENIDLRIIPCISDVQIKINPCQFDHILVNLAVNARDAMPLGGQLTLEAEFVELDENSISFHGDIPFGEYVLLKVSDTGCGMNQEVREHLFEPFFTTKENGTGLGLAMVYGVTKKNGGYIQVDSEEGQGTTFRIYLPKADKKRNPLQKKIDIKEHGGIETIFLVEDEFMVRKVAQRILERQGYRVFAFSNGIDALKALESTKESVHLLFTDLILPGMSGQDLAKKVKRLKPEINILFSSGHTRKAPDHFDFKDTHFLDKPYSSSSLSHKVRQILDSASI